MSSNAIYTLPDAAQVNALLGLLFDSFVAKPGPTLNLTNGVSNFAGVFVNDAGQPVAICACDIAFAANGAAALSILPPKAATDAVKDKALTAVMTANLREIFNICTRLLLRDDTPHLRLQSVSNIAGLSPDAALIVASAKRRADFAIALGKYGSGTLTVLAN